MAEVEQSELLIMSYNKADVSGTNSTQVQYTPSLFEGVTVPLNPIQYFQIQEKIFVNEMGKTKSDVERLSLKKLN